MYESHWGLRESPFRGLADARFYYNSPTHEEALARLDFLIAHQRRLGLLLGDGGSGKTMLLEVFCRQLRSAGCQVATVNLLSLASEEFLWELATELRRNPRAGDTPFQLWRSIVDRIAENRYQQVPTVLLLDDADEASPDVLTHIARLLRQDTSPESPLTVVLAADSHRVERLGRRILELCELRIELEAWDSADTWQFLRESLAKAGTSQSVFDNGAAVKLHELTQGVPRQVSYLADLALVAGAGQQLPLIDAVTIENVYHELSASM